MAFNLEIVGDVAPVDEPAVRRAQAVVNAAMRYLRRTRTGTDRTPAMTSLRSGFTALYQAQPNQFELPSTNAEHARTVMAQLGMLDVDSRPLPFPTFTEFGVTEAMIEHAAAPDGSESRELALYHAAYDAMLDRQAMANPTGIPAYKLKTADGWLVTPDEISAALGAYRTEISDGSPEPELWWWPHFVEFLERAEKHLGFRVH